MCGIVGYTGRFSTYLKRKELFTQLLYVDALRGFDSTGVFGVEERPNLPAEVRMAKRSVPSLDFLDMGGDVKEWFNKFGIYDYIVGHNRKATQGRTTNANAHPFQHGKVTLVHNGTLATNWRTMLGRGQDANVDSEAIAILLGEADEPDKVLGELDGSFTLVWWDHEAESLNIIRNEDRPFALGAVKEGGFVFASELGMLRWLTGRVGIEIGRGLAEVKAGVLISITGSGKQIATRKVRLREPTPISYGTYYQGQGWNRVKEEEKEFWKDSLVKIGDTVTFQIENLIGNPYYHAGVPKINYEGRSYGYPSRYDFKVREYSANREAVDLPIPKDLIFKAKVTGVCKTKEIIPTLEVKGVEKIGNHKQYKRWKKEIDRKCFEELKREEENSQTIGEIIHLPPPKTETFYSGPDKKFYTEKSMEDLIKDGCCVCGDPLTLDDVEMGINWWYQFPYCVEHSIEDVYGEGVTQ